MQCTRLVPRATSKVICCLVTCGMAGCSSGEEEAAALAAQRGALEPLSVVVQVDVAARRRPIRPEVYGVSFATAEALTELNVPLHRSGGNAATRYNWQLNASNRAADWYFESLGSSTGSTPGADVDAFISASRGAGAAPMVTLPTLGWVARLGANRSRLASFSVARYGPQQDSDPYFPDAGNGVRVSGAYVTGNEPSEANLPVTPAFQQQWVRYLISRWGAASAGGVRYYLLDNEPSLWFDTHRDVRPVGVTMEEVRDRLLAYGQAVKDVDPGALLVGPEEWGWSGYLFSGYDQQYGLQNGWSYLPDRAAHGGMDYLPWLLEQLRGEHERTGRRTLDVLSVHYYPQSGEFGNDTSTTMQARRNRSTRSLWDPRYVDESWIGDTVKLIPRLRQWVDTYYPGTRIAITEYSWGADTHINGATAQADVLGIFGREGLDLAARWLAPKRGTLVYNAFRMYRNYDGQRSTFGDTSVSATAPDPDDVAAYAAERSRDGALTVMLINKNLTTSRTVTARLAGFQPRSLAQVWRLTSRNVIERQTDVAVSAGAFVATLPRQSITLFVIPRVTQ
jgi:hypothetical protein